MIHYDSLLFICVLGGDAQDLRALHVALALGNELRVERLLFDLCRRVMFDAHSGLCEKKCLSHCAQIGQICITMHTVLPYLR